MTAADICRQVFDAGMTMHADDGALVIRPAERLTTALRALLVEHKPELLDFVRQAEALTAEILAAAMRCSDHHGDGAQAREDWKRDIADTPTHLRADLLDHLRQTYRGPA